MLEEQEGGQRKVKFVSTEDADMSESDDEVGGGVFLNPLLAGKQTKKQEKEEEEVWSDEEDEKAKKLKEQKSKKDIKLGKRKKREADEHDFFADKGIEEVPQENFDEKASDMDSDDMAETRALAKVMLRKKARTEIIDSTYNRYAIFEDENALPSWFVEDEKRHYRPNLPVTKEMVAEEKRALKVYNERPSKKVLEAKGRKKRRLGKAMNKIKQKAQIIAEQDLNEGSKMRQIQKLYKTEKSKQKEEKKYVVSKNFSHIGKAKVPRHMKVVDKRMKKDIKMAREKAKKAKKGGKGGSKKKK